MLVTPENAGEARALFSKILPQLLRTFKNERILAGLKHVDQLVGSGQVFDALKEIRALYPLEQEVMHQASVAPQEAAVAMAAME